MISAKPPTPAHPWSWFTDHVLPSLFVAVSLAVGGAAWWTHQTVGTLVNTLQIHQKQIEQLQVDIGNLRSASVSRVELVETLKRVEQQLEIMMLRAGIKPERSAK